MLLSPCGCSCVEFCQPFICSPNAVLWFWWSGDLQAPSAAREQGFHPVVFWLQRLSWVDIVRYVWQICDLMDSSVSPFSVDISQYKVTVSVGSVSRCGFLCYFQAGPAKCPVCVSCLPSLCPLCRNCDSTLSRMLGVSCRICFWLPCAPLPYYDVSFLCWVFCVPFLERRPVCGWCSPVFVVISSM